MDSPARQPSRKHAANTQRQTPAKKAKLINPPVRQSIRQVRRKQAANTQRQTPAKKPRKQAANTQRPTLAKKPNQGVQSNAKYVVGIDYGTTHSGHAIASMDDPEKVFTFENWPGKGEAGASRYGKTLTCLRYEHGEVTGNFKLLDWGWPAHVNHCEEVQEKSINETITMNSASLPRKPTLIYQYFKLLLADGDRDGARDGARPNYAILWKQEWKIPEGLSRERLTADFLRELHTSAVEEVKNRFGSFIQKKDIKCCLTVPTIWTEEAKHIMRVCSQMGGLVHGPHCRDEDASLKDNFEIVLEPEAASVYCLQKLKETHDLRKGSKVLVVDAGGGTVDLVVHELVDDSGLRVKGVTSTGAVCGGIFVDIAFKEFLARKIDCFERLSEEQPASILTILRDWEGFKYGFSGQQRHVLYLSAKIRDAWEKHHVKNQTWSRMTKYDEVLITSDDMKSFFDGQVNQILEKVKEQLDEVSELGARIEAIFVVGGFSNSPYLMGRIRAEFSSSVKHITSPIDPGSAVCQGAVMIGTLGVDIVMSRKSRKTYGVSMYRPFSRGDPQACYEVSPDSGEALCKDAFDIFARIGDEVPVNHCVCRQYRPYPKGAPSIVFTMYATTDPEPTFVTDTGVEKVGSWTYRLPLEAQRMKTDPSVRIAMYFGRTHIEVSAEPLNFNGGRKKSMFSVSFDRELIDDGL